MTKLIRRLLILMSCLLIELTGCVNISNFDKIVQRSKSQSIEVNDIQESVNSTKIIEESKDDLAVPNDIIDASEYIKSIADVEAYAKGKYVVYGTNTNDMSFCGILYSSGNLKVFDDYTRIYALKDGRLLATTEENAGDMLYSSARIKDASITGKIIDENGNIIFSDDRYLRFIIAGDDRLFALLANSGFDGLTLDFGIIDCDGNWVCELNSENEISSVLKDHVDYKSDNTWDFGKEINPYAYDPQTTVNRESGVIQLYTWEGDILKCSVLYSTLTDEIVKSEYKGKYSESVSKSFSNNSVAYCTGSGAGSVNSAGVSFYSSPSYEVCTLKGNIIEEFTGTLFSGDYYYNEREGLIKNVVNGITINLPESFLGHIVHIYTNDENFYSILYGEDERYYIAKTDSNGVTDENPTFFKYYDEGSILFFDDVVVYTPDRVEKAYIADLDSYDVLCEIETSITGYGRLYKLDDATFAIRSSNKSSTGKRWYEWAIYNLNGEELY